LISSSEFAFTACFGVLADLVTVTDITVPFAAVTVVVTVPSGAVVTAVLSAEEDEADEFELLVEFELVIEFGKVSVAGALPTALTVISFSPIQIVCFRPKNLYTSFVISRTVRDAGQSAVA